DRRICADAHGFLERTHLHREVHLPRPLVEDERTLRSLESLELAGDADSSRWDVVDDVRAVDACDGRERASGSCHGNRDTRHRGARGIDDTSGDLAARDFNLTDRIAVTDGLECALVTGSVLVCE